MNRSLPNFAAAVQLLTKAPRRKEELGALLSIEARTVDRYLKALMEEGLVSREVEEESGFCKTYRYSWSPDA